MRDRVSPDTPERYRRLVREVLQRLPDGWAGGEEWSVTVADDPAARGFAYARGAAVTLLPSKLDTLSDPACRWAIAHEFGHVAPVLPRRGILAGRHCLYVNGRWRASTLAPARLEDL